MLSNQLQDTALRYFLEVVRSGSLSEAALRLNVTASAVSRQVAALEALLGVPLFERRPRGMVASAAGELLAAFALRGALEADRVVAEIQALQGLRRGRVRVASSAGFAIEFLPRAIAVFRERFPGLQFHVRVASPAEATAIVLRGEADIGITYSRATEQGIRVEHRQPAPVIAIMRPDHALARFRSVSLAQMQAYPLALPEGDNTVRQLFDLACGERGIVFEPVLVTNHFETLTNFVVHGGGLSISGEVTVRDRVRRGELHAAELRERGMRGRAIELQTLNGRTLPEGVRAFLDFLREQLAPPR
ncbi:LysR family transcriptional regulator [Cupriavidus sp. USMAA2-4]|uniref:LysR substrate-binding domain-containing protein n=1 Tax=Cupriavidus sp. USMAA2-4 TaxID=876364 RepID=UPI0008A6DD27|nr:LysR substrate-binding domain-containing protein [Cupriavidus sp. USMAA2-4]AOY92565.1 LysR family transcriptional regulator [Cupriavidus sp. USMAA2-4]